jgi:hypothetical protein
MTLKERLNVQKRRIWALAFGGMVLCYSAIFIFPGPRTGFVALVVGFIVFFGVMFYGYFGIRCLRCNARIGQYVMGSGTPLAVSKSLNFCPSCGKSIHEKV